jgi:flagellar M-ring protein FliF
MRDRLTAGIRRGTAAFGSFTVGQKTVTVVAVLALAIGGYFFSTWATTPTYAPLFSNLSATDASAIVDKLTADGTSYKLAAGGNTIMVPKDEVYDLRIKLSGAGLPTSGEGGYSLLDKQNVMTSEFMQQVGYRRAMEGELAKTIKSIDGVKAATVHLAVPQKDVFTDDQQKPTASVLVATAPGKSLRGDQIQAVVHLVASSVEGLDPANVTLVGADGKVLSSGDASGASDERTNATHDYENRLNGSLQRMLDQVLGAGNAVVNVTADLDFDNTETKTQKYVSDPSTPPLAETTKTEKYRGGTGGAAAGTVLGPDNIQVPTNPSGAAGGGDYENSTSTRNNAVGVVTETRKSAPGAVRKLSVAVMLNSNSVKGANEAQLQQLISSAVGLDGQRGDTIAVTAVAFDKSAAAANAKELADAEKADQNTQLYSMIKTGAAVLGVLVLIALALLGGRRRNKRLSNLLQAELEKFDEEQQASLSAANNTATAAIEAGNPAVAALPASPEEPDEESVLREQRQREIAAIVQKQPEEVAALLRGWLADRRG